MSLLPSKTKLGEPVRYGETYAPESLIAIPRSLARKEIGFGQELPFLGSDLWNCYELTWLDRKGKPIVAAARIVYSAESPNLIESKSLKLYLMSFAAERFESPLEVAGRIEQDVSSRVGSQVSCAVMLPNDWQLLETSEVKATLIDGLEVSCSEYKRSAGLLSAAGPKIRERLGSHLLRSLCPVTGQPDYASVLIEYEGPKISHKSLVCYLASLRNHRGFHEECCEMIFKDILEVCRPAQLLVACNFTRRGGIDINPMRKSRGCGFDYEFCRLLRQ